MPVVNVALKYKLYLKYNIIHLMTALFPKNFERSRFEGNRTDVSRRCSH